MCVIAHPGHVVLIQIFSHFHMIKSSEEKKDDGLTRRKKGRKRGKGC